MVGVVSAFQPPNIVHKKPIKKPYYENLPLLHSERPKLNGVLGNPSVIRLKKKTRFHSSFSEEVKRKVIQNL